jgi:hypothetical protein
MAACTWAAKPSDVLNENGAKVEAAIRQKYQLPSAAGNIVRNVSAMDLKPVFENIGYRLSYTNIVLERPGKFTVQQMEWDSEKRIHDEQVRVRVVAGLTGQRDALARIIHENPL